jgi:hypothetical protein
VPEHVRVDRWHPHSGGRGEGFEAAGGGVAVHPKAVAVEQDRTGPTAADGAGNRWRQRHEDGLVALPHTRRSRWPCSSPRSTMVVPVAAAHAF